MSAGKFVAIEISIWCVHCNVHALQHVCIVKCNERAGQRSCMARKTLVQLSTGKLV